MICGDTRRHRLLAATRGEVYDTRLEAFLLAAVDASLFAQNMALALESMGYGICYIGGLRNDLPGVQDVLGCPEGVYPMFGMCTGHPADDPISRPRIDPAGVLFEERYPDDQTMLDELDRSMQRCWSTTGRGRPVTASGRRRWSTVRDAPPDKSGELLPQPGGQSRLKSGAAPRHGKSGSRLCSKGVVTCPPILTSP